MSDADSRVKITLPNVGPEENRQIQLIFDVARHGWDAWEAAGFPERTEEHMAALRAQSWVAWTCWSLWEDRAHLYMQRIRELKAGFKKIQARVSLVSNDVHELVAENETQRHLLRFAFHLLSEIDDNEGAVRIGRGKLIRKWLDQAVKAKLATKTETGRYTLIEEDTADGHSDG
jgi:hypothetical protein